MIKIIQYYVGNNNRYLELCNLVKDINQRYCKLHKYEYLFQHIDEELIKRYYGECNSWYIIAYKVKFIEDMLEKQDADYLVFIDADAAISKPQIRVEDIIDQNHLLFLSRGNERWMQIHLATSLRNLLTKLLSERVLLREYYDQTVMKNYDMFDFGLRFSYGDLMFNLGLMVIKNTPTTRLFFKLCYNNQLILKQIPDSKMTLDGRAISFTLLYLKYRNIYTFLYPQAQGGICNSYETRYNLENTFVLHNFGRGTTQDQKTYFIHNLLSNKWWKQILEIQ